MKGDEQVDVALYSDLILLEAPPESVRTEPLTEVQKASWLQGIPAMVLALPSLDPEAMFAMAAEVKDILKKHQPERAEEIEKMWAVLSTDPAERAAFVNDLVNRPAGTVRVLPRNGQAVKDIRAFLADQSIKPFVIAYAEKAMADVDLGKWDKGYCPACGSQPGFARLSKAAGKRSLYCSLCETEWSYRRLGCPFCGSTDHEKLQYFTVEGEHRYRVDVCDNCKGYVKTLDAGRLLENEKVYLFLEDVKTMHLDALAQREGYTCKPVASQN